MYLIYSVFALCFIIMVTGAIFLVVDFFKKINKAKKLETAENEQQDLKDYVRNISYEPFCIPALATTEKVKPFTCTVTTEIDKSAVPPKKKIVKKKVLKKKPKRKK